MSPLKSRLLTALALICAASFVTFMEVKANEATDDQISIEAVWTPDSDSLNEIFQACKNSEPAGYQQCFVDQMGNFASSEAVAFSQQLAEEKPSRLGYLAGVREAGPVDLGYVAYPVSGGATHGWVLLNGTPALIPVDDLSRLPQAQMEKDAQFRALRSIHPEIHLAVDSDDRKPDMLPQIAPMVAGSETFIIPYSLRGSCSSSPCMPLAHASFGFDFDAAGEFLGVRFIKISAETH